MGMFGTWHLGGGVARIDGSEFNKTNLLTNPKNDWSNGLVKGPKDVGFDTSLITVGGVQHAPFIFLRNVFLEIDPSNAVWWRKGSYPMPHGTSIIHHRHKGEGSKDWDASAYNMILVNKTSQFIENHLQNNNDTPFLHTYLLELSTNHIYCLINISTDPMLRENMPLHI